MASRSEVTNPRDRIYGVLGLLPAVDKTPQVNHGIVITYEAEINEVFRESTKRCLQVTESSRVLAGSAGCLGHDLPGLPSWAMCPVRRVAVDGIMLNMPFEGSKTWKSSRSSGWRPLFDIGGSLLGVCGFVFDRVMLVGTTRVDLGGSHHSVAGLIQWAESVMKWVLCYFEWKALANLDGAEFYQGSSETIIEAFRQTLCAAEPFEDLLTDDYRERFRKFDEYVTKEFSFLVKSSTGRVRTRDKFFALGKCLKGLLQYMTSLSAAANFGSEVEWCVNKKFVRTDMGYIGIASHGTQEGDCVVLLAGAQTPFILRPDGPRWTIAGECYIHGIMNGEAWDESKCNTLWIK